VNKPTLLFLVMLATPLTAQDTVPVDSVPGGSVVGTVLDAETGVPLAGAVVTLEPLPMGAAGRAMSGSTFWSLGGTTVTDRSGAYRFNGLPVGSLRLVVRRLGYEPATVRLDLFRQAPMHVSVGLLVLPVRLAPTKITAPIEPFARLQSRDEANSIARMDAELFRQRMFPAADARILTHGDVVDAVTLGETDLFRAMHRLPGVTTRDDYTAAIWTRGAPWSHTRVYFDGLPLFNPVHTGGVFTGVNPDIIGAAFFHPGVRSAADGEGAAAVLDLSSRRATEGWSGLAELSMVSGRVAMDRATGRNGWTLAARRSYVDLVSGLLPDSGDIPYALLDVAGRGDVALGSSSLEVSGMWERDNVRGTVRDIIQQTRGHWGNAVGTVTLTSPVGKFVTRHTVGVTRFAGRLNVAAFSSGNTFAENTPIHSPMESSVTYVTLKGRLEPQRSSPWAVGYDAVYQSQQYRGPYPRPYPEAILDDTLSLEEAHPSIAFWGEGRWEWGSVSLVGGLRAEVTAALDNKPAVALAPRLTARWMPNETTTLSVGAGRSFQYTQALAPAGPGVGPELHLTDVWLMAGDTIPVIRSDVITAGVEQWLGGGWLAAMNLYGRRATGIAVPDPQPGSLTSDRAIFVPGTNTAGGMEFSLRRLAGRWTASLAYTLGSSRMRAGGWEFPASADRRDVVDATAAVRVLPSLRVGASFTAASGTPYTRVLVEEVACTGPAELCIGGPDTLLTSEGIEAPNANRTRSYVGLNFLAEWWRQVGSSQLTVYVQLRNALNRRNAVTYLGSFDECGGTDDVLVAPTVCDRFDRGLPLFPFVGVSVSF
jgi:hypothetical protein